MSSRKKKNQGDANGSSRNLDGRRLRTITEAKALAEYLALKPDMDKKEKEERRKRWQQIVEMAEQQQDELKNGNKVRLNEKWLEDKDEASERTREAVIAALQAGEIKNVMVESDASDTGSEQSGSSDNNDAVKDRAEKTKASTSKSSRTFFGWDDDEEMMSDSEEDEDEEDAVPAVEGKGKGRA
jgi:Silencing defective 2 N-terminal ubiquitin domain